MSEERQDSPPEKDWPVWAKACLAALALTGQVTKAADAAGVDRHTVANLRRASESFAAAYEQAKLDAAEMLEAEAVKRANEGWDEPVFYRGEVCGTVRKYSDTLLIFLLKGALPEKYRERYDAKVSGTLDVNAAILNAHKAATGGA